jgi:two-component system response regulator NreC
VTKKRYRIVIAEDHRILREGLRFLLSSNPDFEIVGETEDGRGAIRCVDQLRPDLILMDLSMPKRRSVFCVMNCCHRTGTTAAPMA